MSWLPEMPEWLAAIVLAGLVIGTIGHLIFRTHRLTTKGFSLNMELAEVSKMITDKKSYESIMKFINEHPRGSDYPIVAHVYSMVYQASKGINGFVRNSSAIHDKVNAQHTWYIWKIWAPAAAIFLVSVIAGGTACSALPFSRILWGVGFTTCTYWGAIAMTRTVIALCSGSITNMLLWDVFTDLLARANREHNMLWKKHVEAVWIDPDADRGPYSETTQQLAGLS
jgi:hypothetical protein